MTKTSRWNLNLMLGKTWRSPTPSTRNHLKINRMAIEGGSLGLVVMGGDSRFEGHGFESQRHILDGYFFTLFFVKLYWCLFEKTKNKQKNRPGMAHFLKKNVNSYFYKIIHFVSGEITTLFKLPNNLDQPITYRNYSR